jgi:hypothetical protein
VVRFPAQKVTLVGSHRTFPPGGQIDINYPFSVLALASDKVDFVSFTSLPSQQCLGIRLLLNSGLKSG